MKRSASNVKDGIVKEYYKDGSLSATGKNKNGKKTGVWKYYLKNGVLRATGKVVKTVKK
jgi:antitoxin component YwqK of YwqJK toxin-antitoxin module